MVFHVAGAVIVGAEGRTTLKLVENLVIGLAHHRAQHVQAAAVRHADDDLVNAQRAAALDHLFQRRDDRFAAINAEPLGAGIAAVQESFEALGLDQLFKDRLAAHVREADFLVGPFNAFLQP